MAKFFDDAKNVLKKGYESTKIKAEEYGKIGKAKGETVILKQKLAKTYQDLGEAVRPLIEKDKKAGGLAQEEIVKELLRKLAEIEKTIKEKDKEIEEAKAESAEKARQQRASEKISKDES
jgi:transposase